MDFGVIPQCQIPPVVHSVYVPNKPRIRTNTNQNLGQIDTHLELIQRQHSYNTVDYDLQRRLKVQQQARSQLLSENPSFSKLLDENGKPFVMSTHISPVPAATAINIPPTSQQRQQSTTISSTPSLYTGNETPSDIDQHRSTQQPQRRAFGEMMRDGGFANQRSAPNDPKGGPNTQPKIPTAQPIANLNNTELSNSDSFVMIEDDDTPHPKPKATMIQDVPKEKGVTINKNGLKLYDNKKPPTGSVHKQLLCSNVLHSAHGVDLLLAEPGHDVGLMNVDIIKYLQRGISVIKHGRRGRPHTCQLKLSQNCRYFTWDSKNKDDGENVVRFGWIAKIEQGQSSPVFQRNPDSRVASHSLTMSYTRPEKYNHVDDSDDETDSSQPKSSFLPSFFKKNNDDGKSGNGKRSTWKGLNQDFTLDIVIEDPNDWLIWYNGVKMLTDMSANKAINDKSIKLTQNTQISLQLPILSDYPSSAWIVDHASGLTVAEQQENERHCEQNQVQVQVALTRKETFKEIIRRTSSYNGGSQSNIRSYLANQGSSANLQASTTIQPGLLTDQQSQAQADELDLLTQSFPSPWKSIDVQASSDIVHPSWLQQLIYYGPKQGRSCPWVCAYSMSTSGATYDRIIDRVKYTPLEQLGIMPDKVNPDFSAQEVARRQRLYQTWFNQAGNLSILILRTKAGDIIGGFATAAWAEKWGFYGSPDAFVFSIGQEMVTIEPQVGPNGPETNTNAVAAPSPANSSTQINDQNGENGENKVILEEKVFQAHIYRWCGLGRFFQFVSKDAIGFGSNTNEDAAQPGMTSDDANWKDGDKSADKTNTSVNGQPMKLSAPASTGPALTLDKSFQTGFSQPCPIFHSPQLTKEKQFKCMQLEIWIPIPKV